MILHLLLDDKFTDYAINQFTELAPGVNDFVVLVWNEDKKCKYVKQTDKVRVLLEESGDIDYLCRNLGQYRAIISHSLSTPSQARLIASAPEGIKTGWVFWGFELYSRAESLAKCLGMRTKMLYRLSQCRKKIKAIIRQLMLQPKAPEPYQVPGKVFEMLDYCLTDLNEDYTVAKRFFKAGFGFQWYTYYSIDETLGKLKEGTLTGNNILVGNSATFSNNHLEVFRKLKSFSLDGRKIIVPLSYGDIRYPKIITDRGQVYFGDRFHPLMDFMERDVYNATIQSCSVVIMNHYRHQAMGNTITALWMGARVYLSNKSTTYAYLKRLGMILFTVENDLTPKNPLALSPLDESSVAKNRRILMGEYSKKSMNVNIRSLISTLLK